MKRFRLCIRLAMAMLIASATLSVFTTPASATTTPIYYTVRAGSFMAAWGDVYFHSDTRTLSGSMSLFANSSTSDVYYQFCWSFYDPSFGWRRECGSKKYFTQIPGSTQNFTVSKTGGIYVQNLELTIYGRDADGNQKNSVTHVNPYW